MSRKKKVVVEYDPYCMICGSREVKVDQPVCDKCSHDLDTMSLDEYVAAGGCALCYLTHGGKDSKDWAQVR